MSYTGRDLIDMDKYNRVGLAIKSFVACLIVTAVILALHMASSYESESTVYAIGTHSIIIESGEDLFEWDTENPTQYEVGDHVVLKMSTGGTDDTRVDDEILEIVGE